MPQALSSLGSSFSNGFSSNPLGMTTALTGLGTGIAGSVENAQQQSQYNNAQSYLKNIITNPQAYNAAVAQYTQPLNQGLVTTVENATNANLSERGLGGSSAITQSVLAQALAPYILQNQQQGAQALQSSLGNIGALKPSGQNPFTDMSKLLASLKLGGGQAPGTSGLPNGLTGTDPLGLNTPAPGVLPTGITMDAGSMPSASDLSMFLNPSFGS